MKRIALKEVQADRGKDYGKFIDHSKCVDDIMKKLRQVNRSKNSGKERANYATLDWPIGFETALFYMVSKMVRLSTSPNHIDSALDLSSYADLWLKIIEGEK